MWVVTIFEHFIILVRHTITIKGLCAMFHPSQSRLTFGIFLG